MFGNSVSKAQAGNEAQVLAQAYLDQARSQKIEQDPKVALAFYDKAKVAFKNIANARQLAPPLSEVKSALIQARTPDTPEDEALRQRIAEVYFERAELLQELGKFGKAQASYEKAEDWGYEGGKPTSIPPAVMLSVRGMPALAQTAIPTSMPSQQLAASSAEKNSALVEYLFEKALLTLSSLEVPNKPSLFLVYAHDNPIHGKAEASTSKYLIERLSSIRGVNLYSDQTPMGQMYSSSVEDLKGDGKLNDILTNQLCLLPARLIKEVNLVDKVVVCCSEVLGSYLKWPDYQKFYEELREAYDEDREAYLKGGEQLGPSAIREVVRKFSQEEECKSGFHHVLTEMAFLQIRAEHLKGQHGIIPVSLTPNSYEECLAHFIPATAVRMEDILRFEEQAQAGREVHANQSRHGVLFKLIERLLAGSDEAQMFLNKFWQGHSDCISHLKSDSKFGELEFAQIVDSIFDGIRKALHNELVSTVQQARSLFSINLREALYQHYQRSNLSIQRVSGQIASLDDCYINLAIVDSHAQREKDRAELTKQASTFERLSSGEQLQSTNYLKSISLANLFDSQKLRDGSTGIPKRILIQGRAGVGKTTLCKKLVYEYHHNGLWQDQFECVLWVPLRQLKTLEYYSLETLLSEHYFVNQENAKALARAFHQYQDKTLFILDGLHEVVDELHKGRPLSRFLKELLNQKHVVMTSRPAGVDSHLLDQLDLELETAGFTLESVGVYIQKFAPPSSQAAIQQFIERTPVIQGLVNIPIQLDALCYSWDSLPQNQAVTMAMLYEAIVDKLWRKDGLRLEKQDKGEILGTNVIQMSSKAKLAKLMGDEIYYLGYLAFKGLEEGKIEFSLDELDLRQTEFEDRPLGKELSFTFTTDLKQTSFLHTVDVGLRESDRHYHFLHSTFHEFFAAQFLVRHLQAYAEVAPIDLGLMLSQETLHTFIATHKYNPRYEIVWWMVAGLLKGNALKGFFNLLEAAPFDLVGGRHQQMIMGCLGESRAQLDQTIINNLEAKLMQCLQLEMKLSEDAWSELSRQKAFPERLLLTWLDQPAGQKSSIIRILGARPILSTNAISALIDALQDPEWNVRSAAASALGGQATLSEIALQALADALHDKNEVIRWSAVNALGGQATLSEAALEALTRAAQDKNEVVRGAAVTALNGQATQSEKAFQALISALRDKNASVRSGAAGALGGQETLPEAAFSALICALQDPEWNVRDAAARGLGGQETLPEGAIPALIGALQDKNAYVKYTAASTLRGQVTLPEAALQSLVGALQDENSSVQSWATKVLKNQKTLPEAVLQALIGASQDKNEVVRWAAVNALGGQAMQSEMALQALINALQDKNASVRSEAARALEWKKMLPETALNALINALQDPEWNVRSAAASALGGQITLPEAALQALVSTLQNKNGSVRSLATKMLRGQKTLSETALQALIGALQDPEWNVKNLAARVLGDQETLPEGAIPALIGTLEDENAYVRYTAASALSGQGTLPEIALQALVSALQDENASVRSLASKVLKGQKTLPEAALQALIGASRDKNKVVRWAAVNALDGQAMQSEMALQALISALQDQNASVRSEAARALERKRMLPKAALSALIPGLQDSDWSIRSVAARILGGQITLPETALQALIGALQDENASVRSWAAKVLRGQKTLPEAVLQALISALQDESAYVRSAAASALGGQETLPEAAIQTLIEALQDENASVKSWVAKVLRGQRTLSEAALQVLRDTEHNVINAAARVLDSQKMLPEAALHTLISASQYPEWNVRSAAASALGRQATLPEAALQTLIGALQDENAHVRSAAVSALGEQAMLLEVALQSLIGALRDENASVRSLAAKVLRGQKTLPEVALQSLIDALHDENTYVRDAAASAFGDQITLPEAALQSLIGALEDENASVRSWVAKVLRGQKTLPEAALQALVGVLQDPKQNVMDAAVSVLGDQKTLPEATVLALISALQDENAYVKSWAARTLASQQTLPEVALNTLIGALQDPEWNVSDAAASALAGQAALSETVLQALIGDLQNGNASTRYATASALGGHVTQSETALEALISALEDENEYVRDAAASALGGQATLSETALEALISALQDEEEDIRVAAASALGGQATLSEAVLQALIDALQDDNASVRDAIIQALKLNLSQLYRMLPTLEVEQIQILYRQLLFGYSCAHIAPLYVQENKLHFYTETGLEQLISLTSEQSARMIQAFRATQVEVGMMSLEPA